MFDFIIAGPFVATSLGAKPWLQAGTAAIAVIALETFSSLPFAIASVLLGLGLLTMRHVLNIFDASSLLSRMISFLLGIFAYAAYGIIAKSFAVGSLNAEILIRGTIFFIRVITAGIFLGIGIYCIQYSIARIRYAFMEEKITE